MNSHPTSTQSIRKSKPNSIGVKIVGLTEAETTKIAKILQLSAHRKHSYHLHDEQSDLNQTRILITTDLNQVSEIGMVSITFGKTQAANPYHITPPLLSIKVLRVLDNIYMQQIADKSNKAIFADNPTQPDIPTDKFTTENEAAKTESDKAPDKPSDAKEPEHCYQILIVDDSPLIYIALDIELSNAPFNSNRNHAESGETCLELASKNNYDLIFLDIMMPGIDGFKTCTELRKNPKFKKIPIIMLSSKTSPLDEVKGIMAGCTTYLTKPIKTEEFQKLLGRLGNWLENYNMA